MRMKRGIRSLLDIRFFAATWLMLAVGFTQLLGNRSLKAKLLVVGIAVWGLLMLISRVRLGMHYPIDLLVATLLAWLINGIIFALLKKRRSSS